MEGKGIKGGIIILLLLPLLLWGCVPEQVETSRELQLGYGACTVDLPSKAVSVVLPSGASWIMHKGSSLIVLENRNYDPREATVRYLLRGQECTLTLYQACREAILPSSRQISARAEGELLDFPVSANMEVSVSSDAPWLECVAVKGIEQHPFFVTVLSNTSGSARTGKLTFTGGETTRTVTVTQPALSGPLVTRFQTPGVYLGTSWERTYEKGRDQYATLQEGEMQDFLLLDREGREQIQVSGYKAGLPGGYPLTVSVRWKKGGVERLSQQYHMCVLKEDDSRVWIGNGDGLGVIIRK